jgi:hypothetical protein
VPHVLRDDDRETVRPDLCPSWPIYAIASSSYRAASGSAPGGGSAVSPGWVSANANSGVGCRRLAKLQVAARPSQRMRHAPQDRLSMPIPSRSGHAHGALRRHGLQASERLRTDPGAECARPSQKPPCARMIASARLQVKGLSPYTSPALTGSAAGTSAASWVFAVVTSTLRIKATSQSLTIRAL